MTMSTRALPYTQHKLSVQYRDCILCSVQRRKIDDIFSKTVTTFFRLRILIKISFAKLLAYKSDCCYLLGLASDKRDSHCKLVRSLDCHALCFYTMMYSAVVALLFGSPRTEGKKRKGDRFV